jgi:hypothetical protein
VDESADRFELDRASGVGGIRLVGREAECLEQLAQLTRREVTP